MTDNQYTVKPDNSVELSRLLRQDTFLTQQVTGAFPDYIEPSMIRDLLDLGCGPGGWLSRIGRNFPDIKGIGLDISQPMISFANDLILSEHIPNIQYVEGSFVQ